MSNELKLTAEITGYSGRDAQPGDEAEAHNPSEFPPKWIEWPRVASIDVALDGEPIGTLEVDVTAADAKRAERVAALINKAEETR
jgi:hypothetical protein